MRDQAVVIYFICDEIVKALRIKEDPQCKMSTAEVMTFALISSTVFGCDYKRTRLVTLHLSFFSHVLSHSRLVRRIHQISEHVWTMVFYCLKEFLKNKNNNYFIVDSFPVKAYENHKSARAKIFSGKNYHGYSATKKQYFFGLKVHIIIDTDGIPVEFIITPGSCSDIKALKDFPLDLPESSIIMGDKAYTDYHFEDLLMELGEIKLLPKRKKNLKRQNTPLEEGLLSFNRNYIETIFSSIISRMPRYIRARTERGFYLKLHFFILAYLINIFHPLV